MPERFTRIYLIGLPGSGKSTVGKALAQLLDWQYFDLDAEIEQSNNQTISELFNQGEDVFREIEEHTLATVSTSPLHAVVATGGGIVIRERNRQIMRQTGLTIYLHVSPRIAVERLNTPDQAQRPLLVGDPLAKLTKLEQERAHFYAEAEIICDTDAFDSAEVGKRLYARIISDGRIYTGTKEPIFRRNSIGFNTTATTMTNRGLFNALNVIIPDNQKRCFVVIDARVDDLYGEGLRAQFSRGGRDFAFLRIPSGEGSKSMAILSAIYDALVERRHARDETIIAIGGGVVGDLAGFAAATYQRGVPLIHIPTTLLAQVDSAIGGKTGINHPLAKNAIGAFYQAELVICDPMVMATLPERTFREGWGEIIKYGMILDEVLFLSLEEAGAALLNPMDQRLPGIIAQCIKLKTGIVEKDEKESGLRMVLNYGHTIGHAFESLTGYSSLLHGEAVIAGMAVEARIAHRLGMLDAEVVRRQDALSAIFVPDVRQMVQELPPEAVMQATLHDKKVRQGKIRWALPHAIGKTAINVEVDEPIVSSVLRAWLEGNESLDILTI